MKVGNQQDVQFARGRFAFSAGFGLEESGSIIDFVKLGRFGILVDPQPEKIIEAFVVTRDFLMH